jgi:hypothetical protein
VPIALIPTAEHKQTMRYDDEEGWTVGPAFSFGSWIILRWYGHGIDRRIIVRARSRCASVIDDYRHSAWWIAGNVAVRHCEHRGRQKAQTPSKKTMRRTNEMSNLRAHHS